jgi:hypothetical protein
MLVPCADPLTIHTHARVLVSLGAILIDATVIIDCELRFRIRLVGILRLYRPRLK